MAEANAAPAPEAGGPDSGGKGSSSKVNLIITVLVIVNTLVVGAIAFMVYIGKQMEAANPGVDAVVRGELQTQAEEAANKTVQTKQLYPFREFVVNLSGSRGRRVVKTTVELELPNDQARKEIERRDSQIRDTIILILSSRTYEEISGKDGKENLRNEIRETINPSLTEENKILNVYFTDFIYN